MVVCLQQVLDILFIKTTKQILIQNWPDIFLV
jgi:hypothetical protein